MGKMKDQAIRDLEQEPEVEERPEDQTFADAQQKQLETVEWPTIDGKARELLNNWMAEHPGLVEPDTGDLIDLLGDAIRQGLRLACILADDVSESTPSYYPRDAKQMRQAIQDRIYETVSSGTLAELSRQEDKV